MATTFLVAPTGMKSVGNPGALMTIDLLAGSLLDHLERFERVFRYV